MKKTKIEKQLSKLKRNPKFVGDFSCRENVFNQFSKTDDKDIVICYADYENEGYDGSATVLYYRKSTKMYYEVYGSHCSCYGLENQWDGKAGKDEAIVFEELEKRFPNGL